jgi:hypothetical protein
MWIPVVATGMILNSCESVSSLDPCHIGSMEAVILTGTAYELSFGYFGDEEGVMITSFPEHAETCEILNKHWEERILRYVPEADFLGSDTLVVKTIRNWEGTVSLEDSVNLTIVIHVVRYEFNRKLMGKWDWIGSCGGFTGGCWYPDDSNRKQVEFTPAMQYTEIVNDTVTWNCPFALQDSTLSGETAIFRIGFECRNSTYIWFAGDTLVIQGGDFVEEYVKEDIQ